VNIIARGGERLSQQHLNSKGDRPSDPLEKLIFTVRIAAVTIAVVNNMCSSLYALGLIVAMTGSLALSTVPMLEKLAS